MKITKCYSDIVNRRRTDKDSQTNLFKISKTNSTESIGWPNVLRTGKQTTWYIWITIAILYSTINSVVSGKHLCYVIHWSLDVGVLFPNALLYKDILLDSICLSRMIYGSYGNLSTTIITWHLIPACCTCVNLTRMIGYAGSCTKYQQFVLIRLFSEQEMKWIPQWLMGNLLRPCLYA